MVEDFRTRTGRLRRARTNARLFEAIFRVVDDGGIHILTVETIRKSAGMSRGSFYNYYDTLEAFLIQVAEGVGTIINQEQIDLFQDQRSALAQITGYVRYFALRALSDPACAAILLQTLTFTGAVSEPMRQRMLTTFRRAARSGEIDVSSVPRAVEVGLGVLGATLRWGLQKGLNSARISEDTVILLRGFGVSKSRASKLAYDTLPALPKTPLRAAALSRGLGEPISFKESC